MGHISDKWNVDVSNLSVDGLDWVAAYEELLPCFDLLSATGDIPEGWALTNDLHRAHYLVEADGHQEYNAKNGEYESVLLWSDLFEENIGLIRRSLSKLVGIQGLREAAIPVKVELRRRLDYLLAGFASSIAESLENTVIQFLVFDALAGLHSQLAMDIRKCLQAGAIPCGLEIVRGELVFQAYSIKAPERYLERLFSDAKKSSDLSVAAFANSVDLQNQMGVDLGSALGKEEIGLFKRELKKVRKSKPGLLIDGWEKCSANNAVEWLQHKLVRRREIELYQGFLSDLSHATSPCYKIDNHGSLYFGMGKDFFEFANPYSMKVKHQDLKILALLGLAVVGNAILAGTKIPYVEEMQKVYLAGFIPAGFEVRDGKVIYLACPIEEE